MVFEVPKVQWKTIVRENCTTLPRLCDNDLSVTTFTRDIERKKNVFCVRLHADPNYDSDQELWFA